MDSHYKLCIVLNGLTNISLFLSYYMQLLIHAQPVAYTQRNTQGRACMKYRVQFQQFQSYGSMDEVRINLGWLVYIVTDSFM